MRKGQVIHVFNQARISRIVITMMVMMLAASSLMIVSSPSAEAWDPPANTYVWNAPSDSNFNNASNWLPVGVPTAGKNIIFNATSVKNCLIDVSLTVGDLTMDTAYTGKITQTLAFGVDDFVMKKGTFKGCADYLSISGNFTWTIGSYFESISIKATGIGKTISIFASTGNPPKLWVTGNVYTGTQTWDALKVDGVLNILRDKTTTVYRYSGAANQYYNNGTINGPGELIFRYYNADKTETYGTINCHVKLYSLSTVARVVTLATDTKFVKLTIEDTVPGKFTLNTNGHKLSLEGTPQTKIIALGDSITLGSQAAPDTYPAQLEGLIGSFVLNSGSSGARTDQLQTSWAYWLNLIKPSMVVILAGINDIAADRTAEQIKFNLTVLYDIALNAGVKVIACTITPHNGFTPERNQVLSEVNEWIMTQATDDIKVVDTHAAIRNYTSPTKIRDGLNADAVHLNATGCGILANTIYPAVMEFFAEGIVPRLTMIGNPTLNAINSTVTIDGSFNISDGTVITDGSTFVLDGAGTVVSDAQIFDDLRVQESVDFVQDVTVNGTLYAYDDWTGTVNARSNVTMFDKTGTVAFNSGISFASNFGGSLDVVPAGDGSLKIIDWDMEQSEHGDVVASWYSGSSDSMAYTINGLDENVSYVIYLDGSRVKGISGETSATFIASGAGNYTIEVNDPLGAPMSLLFAILPFIIIASIIPMVMGIGKKLR